MGSLSQEQISGSCHLSTRLRAPSNTPVQPVQMSEKMFDTIVIGAGIEGLATAYSLAELGKKVLVLEQFPLPHTRGSSSGQTRITRIAYRHPQYVRMMFDAHDRWRRLETESGLELFRKIGILVLGKGNDPKLVAYERSMNECNAPCSLLSEQDIREKYSDLFDCQKGDRALFEPDGGLLLATHCFLAFWNGCKSAGVKIIDGVEVQKIQPGNVVRVQTDHGQTHVAKSVVVTVGPWAPKFLKDQLDLSLPIYSSRTISTFWKELTPGTYAASKGVPAVLFREDDAPYFFKPTLEYNGLLYFGAHYGHPADPDEPEKVTDALRADYMKKCRQLARKYNIKVDTSAPVVVENCFYTESADTDFILDRHPKFPNVIIGTGFSGHGYKLAPVVGDILARLASGVKDKYDLRMFGIDRFKNTSKL